MVTGSFCSAACWRILVKKASKSFFFSTISRAGRMMASPRCPVVRWVDAEKKRMVSTVSPKNSIRRGAGVERGENIQYAASNAIIARFLDNHGSGVSPHVELRDEPVPLQIFLWN